MLTMKDVQLRIVTPTVGLETSITTARIVLVKMRVTKITPRSTITWEDWKGR